MGRTSLRASGAALIAVLIAAVVAGPASSRAAADTFVPIVQERATAVLVESVCGDPVADGDQASDFGPYESLVHVSQDCPGGPIAASASAHQTSSIGETSMTVFAGALFGVASPSAVFASAQSGFEVTIELPRTSVLTATGILLGSGAVSGVATTLEVTGLQGTVFVQQIEGPFPFGEPTEEAVDQRHAIAPGVYTIAAQTLAAEAIDGANPFVTAESALNVTFEFLVLGDVDGDEDVDFTDLLRILGAWGPCPGCPEDLDGDGHVGLPDLLAMLANWG